MKDADVLVRATLAVEHGVRLASDEAWRVSRVVSGKREEARYL